MFKNILFNGKDSSYLDEKEIGICPQDVVLWNNLTCFENLYMIGKMYDIPKKTLKERILVILEKLHLTDKKDELVSSLSGGMKRRMNIAMATIHNPSVVVLDEPSEGLDPQSRRLLWDYILHQKELGHTVILTTHDMNDIEALAKRIILIGNGEILYDGNIKTLKVKYGSYKNIKIFTKDKIDNIKVKGIIKKCKKEDYYNFIIDSNIISISNFLSKLTTKYNIEDIEIDNESIDDVILKLYEDYEL